MSLFDLTGKVVVITGSSRGIGKASALECAEHGAKVVISSRKQEACDTVAAEINGKHGAGTAIAIAANISDKAGLQHLVDETRRAFGRIDTLVCNAASNPYYGPQEGIADEQFRRSSITTSSPTTGSSPWSRPRCASGGRARSSSSRRSGACAGRP